MTTVPFSMRIEEKLKTSLNQEAKRVDRPASYLASRAISDYLERQKWQRELLLGRMEQAEAGVFVSEDRVTAWVDTWFTDTELPKPEADIFPRKP
jgi:predicted transcriptional regulator